jgi:hypothetical protein
MTVTTLATETEPPMLTRTWIAALSLLTAFTPHLMAQEPVILDPLSDLAIPDIDPSIPITNTLPEQANRALITQTSDLNVARIIQVGQGNVAAVHQSARHGQWAVIEQHGNNNRAFLYQQ